MNGEVAETDGLTRCGTIVPGIYTDQQFLTILDGKHRLGLDKLRIVGRHLLHLENGGARLEIVCRIVDVAAHAVAAAFAYEEAQLVNLQHGIDLAAGLEDLLDLIGGQGVQTAAKAVELHYVDELSYSTVNRLLKKRNISLT